MPRDFTASGGSEAPLRSTGHAWSTISQTASPVPRADGVSSLRMAKNDELSSESDAIGSTEGMTLAARDAGDRPHGARAPRGDGRERDAARDRDRVAAAADRPGHQR